jgi:hypothetical protein
MLQARIGSSLLRAAFHFDAGSTSTSATAVRSPRASTTGAIVKTCGWEPQLIAQFSDAPGDLRRPVRHYRRRPPGCPRLWAGAHPQASPAAVRGHATPVPGFYLGGGGVHPGVPGLLGAGMLAAQVAGVGYGLAGPPAARP